MSERDWFGEDPEPAGQGNGTGGGQRTATRERRRSPLVTTLLVLVVVGIAASLIAQFWTEVLWFDSVDFTPVFLTELVTKVAALRRRRRCSRRRSSAPACYIAYRTRPIYAPVSAEQENLDHYRAASSRCAGSP